MPDRRQIWLEPGYSLIRNFTNGYAVLAGLFHELHFRPSWTQGKET